MIVISPKLECFKHKSLFNAPESVAHEATTGYNVFK